MLNRIFGKHLLSKNLISEEELNTLLVSKKGRKAKPETICVVEKVLTCQQVEDFLLKCNEKGQDFKDYVVEEGILTEDRIDIMLGYEKNIFMIFIDLLMEKDIIKYDQIYPFLEEIQKENKWNDNMLKAVIEWDVAQIVDFYVPLRSPQLKSLTNTLVNSVKRYVDQDMYLEKASVSSSYKLNRHACQEMLGDFRYNLYIEGNDDNLLGIANYFSGLKFEHVDEDVLDNIGEFINCVNGQFATDMSYEDIDIDMASPFYSMDEVNLHNCRVYIIPIHANGFEFRAIYEIHD